MKFITGETGAKQFVDLIQTNGWGRMVTTKVIKPYPGEPWCVDNGAYNCFVNGKPWDAMTFQQLITKLEPLSSPYLAVVPDKIMGGNESLNHSNLWLSMFRNEWPWYLAVQNGMDVDLVEESIIKLPYAGLFIGGDDRFKQDTGLQWVELAHRYGLQVHIGRVGTPRRIRWANDIGADSVDSAFPIWVKDRLNGVLDAMRIMNRTKQMVLC